MSTNTPITPAPASRRRLIALLALALLLVVIAAAVEPVQRLARTYGDTRRCAYGGCADELPGRWSDGQRTLMLDADGSFVARVDGRLMRGTWSARNRQICFVSAGERTCMVYQYMGELLTLDEATYQRR